MQKALNQSACHTLDRFDTNAQLDCGTPKTNPDDQEDFESMLVYQFQQAYWAMVQSTDSSNCLNSVFPFSSTQVLALSRMLAASLSVVTLLITFYL